MGIRARRYAHVPLGVVSLLLIVAIIAWLLDRRGDGVLDPSLLIAAPIPAAVTIAPGAPGDSTASPSTPRSGEALAVDANPPASTREVAPGLPGERYALESGPFTSAEAADRREDRLNRFGYATIRFRKHDVTRHYVVAATGFASVEDARRASAKLGGGTVVEIEDLAEVVLQRLPSLREAVAAARLVRDRGFEPRLGEEVSPTVIYHIRYGQFTSQAAAHARGEELARLGLPSRVVKVR